jgi:phosphate-selective porin OprO/OprP
VLAGTLSRSAQADEPPPPSSPAATPPPPSSRPPAPAGSTSEDDLPQFAVAGPAGFGVVSADGASMLATHWLLQSDYRAFLDRDPPTADRGTFALRFAGMRLDAILEHSFHAQLFANFADNRVTLIEAWIEARLARWARLRIGTFQFPISEERLTPGTALPFISTSVAALLLPARDTGIELLGTAGNLSYNLALVNGTWASGPGGSDFDSGKDVVGRVFVRPFADTALAPIRKLGAGIGGSVGNHTGAPDNPRLATLSSYGGQLVFAYKSPAAAAGRLTRLVPHLTWGYGPVALYADAVWTRERVADVRVDSRAFSAVATVVLTGEDAEPLAFVTPRRAFDPATGAAGAIELVFGAGDVAVGDAAFPVLADPSLAMQRMTVVGLGANWFLSRGVAVLVSYGHQRFRAAGDAPARPDEDTLVARFQLVL